MVIKFPHAKVIQVTKSDWNTDEEFAREIIAGVNPGLDHILQEFPPKSKLDSEVYGDRTRTITKEQIELNLERLTADQTIQNKKLFLLDHHFSCSKDRTFTKGEVALLLHLF